MAIAATAGGAASTVASAASLALSSFNQAASRHTVVAVALDNTSSSVTSITDTKGNTYTLKKAQNGTGIRAEIWACANAGSQTSDIITINVSPNCNIAGAAEEYSGVASFGNTGSDARSDIFPETTVVMQEGSNFTVISIAFACQSGDTLTAQTNFGNERQKSIPAATAAGGALYDNSMVVDGIVRVMSKLSTARQWAVAGVELRGTGNVATTVSDYASGALSPALQVNKDVRYLHVIGPANLAGFIGLLDIASSQVRNATLGIAYTDTVIGIGGFTPYTFAVTSGSLPTGLTLHSATGIIDGTPTVAGTSSFTVTVTDSHAITASRSFTIVVSAAGSGGSYAFVN